MNEKVRLFHEILNKKAMEKGFRSWQFMKQAIPPSTSKFVEDCLWEALNEINWQAILE